MNAQGDLLKLRGSRRLEPSRRARVSTGRSGSPAPGPPSGSAVGLNRLLRVLPGWFPLLPWTQLPHGRSCLPEPGLRAPPSATWLSFRTLRPPSLWPRLLLLPGWPSCDHVTTPRRALPSVGVCAPAVSPASSTAACGSRF